MTKTKKSVLSWSLIAVLMFVAPIMYTEIQAFITTNGVFPTIKAFSAKSKTALAVIFFAFNLLSVAITAILTALPSGYLTTRHPIIIMILFVVATQGIPIYAFAQQPEIKAFSMIVMVGELAAAISAVSICAWAGSRLAKKREARLVTNKAAAHRR